MNTANIIKLQDDPTKVFWVREIEVRLFSKIAKVKPLIFGSAKVDEFEYLEAEKKNEIKYNLTTKYLVNQLNIDIKGVKKLSALQDNGTIDISNLNYSTISQIILGEYYRLEIWIGYRSKHNLTRFVSGEIAFISNEITMRRDHTCHIIYASEFVAQYSQQRINFNINSGINLYAAMNYLFVQSGVNKVQVNEKLKQYTLNEIKNAYATPANIIEMMCKNTNDLSATADSSLDNNLVDVSRIDDKRVIKINQQSIIFRKGNPTVTKDGLKIYLMPTFNFRPGDIIIIDNSFLNISETSLSSVHSNFNANFIDTTFVGSDTPQMGAYMIYEIGYEFQNKGDAFELNVQARALSIIMSTIKRAY